MVAGAIGLAVGIHILAHMTCDFPRLLNASPEKYKPMKPYFGDQPRNYWHFVKGVEGVSGIIMVVLMSIAFTLASQRFRRNKIRLPRPLNKLTGFNAFWYSHHLFVIVYSLLIVHGIELYLTKEWYKKTVSLYICGINNNFLMSLTFIHSQLLNQLTMRAYTGRHGCTWLYQSYFILVKDY